MQNMRGAKEYAMMLRVKHDIGDKLVPNKQDLIAKQWEYVEERMVSWLRKYPEDAILPQYQRIARKYGIKPPAQQLRERQDSLAIWQLYKRVQIPEKEHVLPAKLSYRLARTPKDARSAD
jgi:hypothetical protein